MDVVGHGATVDAVDAAALAVGSIDSLSDLLFNNVEDSYS